MKRITAVLGFVVLFSLSLALAQDTGGAGAEASAELSATTDSGTPEAFTEAQWQEAGGAASVSAQSAEEYTVRLEASGLVPDGLYTTWYVIPGLAGTSAGQEVGPAGSLPNEFRADAQGNATFEFSVPSSNDYRDLVVAYHADDMTHGDAPGAMGEVTFAHLMTGFPKPTN